MNPIKIVTGNIDHQSQPANPGLTECRNHFVVIQGSGLKFQARYVGTICRENFHAIGIVQVQPDLAA